MDLLPSLVEYLKEGYDLPEEDLEACAQSCIDYLYEHVVPDIVAEFERKE